jgi:hypothetical protein
MCLSPCDIVCFILRLCATCQGALHTERDLHLLANASLDHQVH